MIRPSRKGLLNYISRIWGRNRCFWCAHGFSCQATPSVQRSSEPLWSALQRSGKPSSLAKGGTIRFLPRNSPKVGKAKSSSRSFTENELFQFLLRCVQFRAGKKNDRNAATGAEGLLVVTSRHQHLTVAKKRLTSSLSHYRHWAGHHKTIC